MEYIDWVDSILTDIFDIGDVPWKRCGYRGYPNGIGGITGISVGRSLLGMYM